jgi:hypothetical protein
MNCARADVNMKQHERATRLTTCNGWRRKDTVQEKQKSGALMDGPYT